MQTRLVEDVDLVAGIQVTEFARLQLNEEKSEVQDEEIAIIAFWRLNDKKVWRCQHSFMVPSPMKRMVSQSGGTHLLY